MFLGTHFPRLDDKGRLILPARFRDDLEGGLVITKGQERCLSVWPRPGFAELAREVSERRATDAASRAFQRILYSGATQEVPDKQGRITIPPRLRAYAGLERDCAVIGAMERVEIWDATAWEAYEAAQEDMYAQLSSDRTPVPPARDQPAGPA